MTYYDYGNKSDVLSIVVLLLLDFCLYIVCAFSVLVGENAVCVIFYLLATAVLLITVYYAGIYFNHMKKAEDEEAKLEK